ncbi:MAG: tyrosine-type recombinase/integrase, partial [Actinomycetota bacterium]|nr:tyrosine-type recombinase/integrase [Actinomycetota bacterium]
MAITPIVVREWIADLSTTGLSPATVRKAYSVLRRILEVAVESDVWARNPCAGVKAPAESRREMRFLTPDEVATLAEAMDPRYRALVLLACYGGLRWGELAALRRARVDALRRSVVVVEQVQELDDGTQSWGPPKSAAGRRTVPLPRFVSDALADHIGEWALPGADGLVFPSPHGAVLRNGLFHRRFWAPAISRAG